MSAELVAMRRRERDEAVAARDAARAEVAAIQERIDRRRAAQGEITQRRLADAVVPGDATEYSALAGDLAVLEGMLAEKTAALRPIDVDGPAARLAEAEAAHRREQDERELDALQARGREFEDGLCGVIRASVKLGTRLGLRQLSQVYRPSAALERAIRLGVKP